MCSNEKAPGEKETTTNNCFKPNNQLDATLSQGSDKNIPNIVLLGPTGVGKSYFLNGLLGQTNPNIGIFPVGMKSSSCTREISSATGDIFDGKLKNYGIDKKLVKVFDTPGKILLLRKIISPQRLTINHSLKMKL